MPRHALGPVKALAGALIITPHTLLIRFSSFKWWGLTFWRGVPIGFSLIVFPVSYTHLTLPTKA